jgi:hypothetical protein
MASGPSLFLSLSKNYKIRIFLFLAEKITKNKKLMTKKPLKIMLFLVIFTVKNKHYLR